MIIKGIYKTHEVGYLIERTSEKKNHFRKYTCGY